MNHIEQIRQFHAAAGHAPSNAFVVRQAALYTGLQCEELAEKFDTLGLFALSDALHAMSHTFKRGDEDYRFRSCDAEKLLDDDVDLFVVTVGSMLSQGADVDGAIGEVCRANLAKIWPDGTMHKDANGKVNKPADWTAPDLAPFISRRVVPFEPSPVVPQ